MGELIHKKEVPTKLLVVSSFYLKNVSFSDELSFCEESDKPKLILYVIWNAVVLGSPEKFLLSSSISFPQERCKLHFHCEVHNDFEIHEAF